MRFFRPRRAWLLDVSLMFALATPLVGQIAAPIDIRIPAPPSPVAAEGMTHLVYELHVTNFSTSEVVIAEVHALDGHSQETLRLYAGDTLGQNLRRPGLPRDASDLTTIAGGGRAVVFVWITVADADVPGALVHRLTFLRLGSDGDTTELAVETEPQVTRAAPAVIGAPLQGENWFAANGPDNVTGHRRALIPVSGKARIAQRFAIDWVQVKDGVTHTGDPDDNANYYAWGSEALAVADGIVVAVKDGIPENVPGINSRAVEITLETVGGNYVILDIGEGRYAFYAHLQPGSLRVSAGDRVRRGDLVGLMGNSGNSTEPHLHFHVADAPSPLGSEGIPYVFDAFEVTGRAKDFGSPHEMFPAQLREREIPLANVFVRFRSSR